MRSAALFAFTLIFAFSLSTIWSTTPDLFINQLTFILIAIFLALLVSRLDPGLLKALSFPAYFLAILLLLLTFALGELTRGSVRWISIGPFNLQTSEISKPLLILFFANLFSTPIISPLNWLIKKLLFLLPVVGLVFLQPDLGSAIVLGLIWYGMLFYSPISRSLLLKFSTLILVMVPLSLGLLAPYQRERLTTFLNPYGDPQGSGYNVIQSQIAIGSGKFLGKGVRQGTQSHLKFLPERHTDFAFASFAEEFGFLGTLFLISSFAIILIWLINQLKTDLFSNLIIVGAFWQLFSQLTVNLGMNLGIMPVTGITLPLFSYGGSSLLSFGLTFGLVLAIIKTRD